MDVGKDEVTIRTGKQSSKKIIQCAVQSLVVLFNTQVCYQLLMLPRSIKISVLLANVKFLPHTVYRLFMPVQSFI